MCQALPFILRSSIFWNSLEKYLQQCMESADWITIEPNFFIKRDANQKMIAVLTIYVDDFVLCCHKSRGAEIGGRFENEWSSKILKKWGAI